jgi:hypothetical protein
MLTDTEKQKIRDNFWDECLVKQPSDLQIADYWLQILDKAIKDKLEAVESEIKENCVYHQADYRGEPMDFISKVDVLDIINKHK